MRSSSHNPVMSAMFDGRKGDRPPVGNPTSIVCHGLMDAAGVSFPHAHLDPNAMAELALAGHEIGGFDTVMPEYSVQQEAAALRCEVDWGDRDRMPVNINNPYEDFSDIEVLYLGTPEDVHRQVQYAVAAGVNIIGPKCAIPLATPLENLKAIAQAASYG